MFVLAQMEGRDTGVSFKELVDARAGDGGASSGDFEIRDGVAVLTVQGVMERRLNLFSDISGGVSSQQLARRIRKAAADSDVAGILLDIDSPGGSVFAVEEIAEAIVEAVAVKPVVAHSYALMCSAAYWIAAQCSEIVVGANAEVGSIGVAIVHYDFSDRDREAGVRRTFLTAGKYKRITADNAPLSTEGRAYEQAQLDTYYSLFVNAVAEGRDVSPEQVLEDMADGRTFIGEQALEAGLVDHIGNIETALALAGGERRERMPASKQQTPTAPAPSAGMDSGGETVLTLESQVGIIKPESEQLDAAHAEGAEAERKRVLAIMDTGADMTIVRQVVESGGSDGQAYKAMVEAEREAKEGARETIEESLGGDHAGASGKDRGTEDGKGFMVMVDEYQKAKGCKRSVALRSVAKANPAAHAAYIDTLGGE